LDIAAGINRHPFVSIARLNRGVFVHQFAGAPMRVNSPDVVITAPVGMSAASG
jgi:hypothetical protein